MTLNGQFARNPSVNLKWYLLQEFLAAKQALHSVISQTHSLTDWLTLRQLALLPTRNPAKDLWVLKVIRRHLSMDKEDLVGMVDMVDMVDNMDMVDNFSMVDSIDMMNILKTYG